MEGKKIAVLGGGAGGHAMAADLTLKGVVVRWCEAPKFVEKFKIALERQEIEVDDAREDTGSRQKIVKIHKVTTSFKDAIKNADYIMIAVPAFGHRLFFTSMIPYLEDGQTIITCPGNFGTLLLANMLRERGATRGLTLTEMNTLPYGCRLISPSEVYISTDAKKICLASFPAKNLNRVFDELKAIYSYLEPCENVIAASLSNPNLSVHPIGTILNTAWIETLKSDFYLYKIGLTPAVLRAAREIYDEIQKVGDAISVNLVQYPETTFCDQATIMGAAFDREKAITEASGPSSLKSRYISEDVPYGLVPVALLARQFDISTPIIDSVIALASMINKTDYYKEGRSLQELGIAGLSKDELARLLKEGWVA